MAQSHNRAIDLPSWLAAVIAPIHPLLKRVNLVRKGSRDFNPSDILLPEGYIAEVVASGFSAPVHCCFDEQGICYVTESGHKTNLPPRIYKVDVRTGRSELFFAFPKERYFKAGAATGSCWHGGYLYVNNTDTVSRISRDGRLEDIVTGLPGRGDHQANHPLVGPDGKLYWGQGSVTNNGVVGADNFAYEWLADFPDVHDVPAHDITLTGQNYEYPNVLDNPLTKVQSGAFVPFGTTTQPGQVIPGSTKCNGAILRCNPDGSNLEVVAWGLRNPYGIAFHPDGRLFCTEHGMDDRGARYVVGDLDDFYAIELGRWYGWPDFASGIPLTDPAWGDGGQGREPVLAEHPEPNPPKPFVSFPTHTAANGFDFCRSAGFGFENDAFVALFGDLAPITTLRLAEPAGYKVVRIDMQEQRVVDFAVNRIAGPASKLPHAGFERPSHCQFGPDGALYVVDFGEIDIAPEAGAVRVQQETGTLWRIRRTDGPQGDRPPAPIHVPFYVIQYASWALGALAVGFGLRWLLRRRR